MVRLEDLREAVFYFNKWDMDTLIQSQRQEADKAVQAINSDSLLSTPVEDIVASIATKFELDVPSLLRDEAHLEEPRETTITVQDYGRAIHQKGTLLTLVVPFTGDAGMFWVRPNTFDSAPPRGNLNNNTIVLQVRGANLNQEAVLKTFNSTIDDFERYLGWQRPTADQFNAELKQRVRNAVETRKARILADRSLVANLPFKIRSRPDAPKTYVAPVTRKNVVQRTIPSSVAPFKPEPALEDKAYNEILDLMQNMTLVMERSPSAFVKMGEEDIRQHFLVQLNGQFEGAASGETFNCEGKTDILIRVDGKNIFIAECKFWTGPKAYLETIDQLLGYLSWRDTKTAVVIFNRNKDFSNVLKSIIETTETHPNKKRGPEMLGETRFRYTFSNPKDANRELVLTVMVFDIPHP